jgi:hypothetical protein
MQTEGKGEQPMLKKKYIKSRRVWKVYFEIPQRLLPQGVEAREVNLVGDFNEWNPSATPMKACGGDMFKAALELQPGTTYQFRYLVNGEYWFNDESADAYAPSGYGEDNGVLRLRDA